MFFGFCVNTFQNELVPQSPRAEEEQQHENEEADVEVKEAPDILTFTAPEALLRPVPANPLRIFVRLFIHFL